MEVKSIDTICRTTTEDQKAGSAGEQRQQKQPKNTHVLGQTVVIATQAEDEVAGLSDVDPVSDVLEQEGEAFASGQRRHVALGQRQVSGGRNSSVKLCSAAGAGAHTRTSLSGTAPPAERSERSSSPAPPGGTSPLPETGCPLPRPPPPPPPRTAPPPAAEGEHTPVSAHTQHAPPRRSETVNQLIFRHTSSSAVSASAGEHLRSGHVTRR